MARMYWGCDNTIVVYIATQRHATQRRNEIRLHRYCR